MIRRAEAADVDAIAALFRRSFGTLTFLPKLHTAEEDRAHLAGVVAKQEVWVAEEGGRVAGFIALDGDLGTYFYVDPDAHRQGIGSRLFEHVQRRRPAGFK